MSATFEDRWCSQSKMILKASHPEWDDDVLEERLHSIYNARLKDPSCTVTNNYRNTHTRTTLSAVYNLLLSKTVILGGDGCMFVQHEAKLSLLVLWIKELMADRKALKKKRDIFEKGSPEYDKYDLAQSNKKIMINSLYGILGYMKFHLFNVNLAQATTAMGQQIISTATCHIENFISDNINFVNINEVVTYIYNIMNDFEAKYDSFKYLFSNVPEKSAKEVAERLSNKIKFSMTQEDAMFVSKILFNMDPECLKMVYYMNNIDEFLEIPFIKHLVIEMLNSISILRIGDISTFDHLGESWNPTKCSPDTLSMLHQFFDYLKVFVIYKHQVFDKVRRTRYTDKHAVLYIDTDSNFISLNKFVQYAFAQDSFVVSDKNEDTMKIVNIFTMMTSMSIAEIYQDFCECRNINEEYSKMLAMKNEFYYPIIMFGTAKKRYIARNLIQEGKMITNPDKQRLIAGFDFKKAGTKAEVRKKCVELIDRYILFAEDIDVKSLIREILAYKSEIIEKLKNNESQFYKQLTVQPAERYKAPLSNQGYKSVYIWNAFNPTQAVAFPVEVDIVPITLDQGMTKNKYLALKENPEEFFNSNLARNTIPLNEFYRKHRDIFDNYYYNLLMSPNSCDWTLALSSIAKPRDLPYMPEWLSDIIDTSKITTNVINLLNPVIEPLGPVIQRVNSTTSHFTNIVEI